MKNFILFIFVLIGYTLSAQTGIGGVGTNDGTSTFSAWYDANQGITTTGTAVTQWNDQSGYGNNATPPAVGNRPTLTAGALNSYPVLTFDGSNDYLTAPDAASLDLTTWSIFIVGQINTHKNYNAVIVKGADAQENYEFLTNYPGTGNFHYPVRHTSGGRSTHSESGASFSNTAYGVYQLDYDQTNFNIYVNGTNTETDAETRVPLTNNNSLYICNEQGTGTARSFSGTIAEIAIFSSPVNSAQRIIINNYLAAKYNFSLTANDLYNEDDNGNYDHDVAGIGRVDASNIHNDAQGTGIVRILNPTGLGNDEFMIWGHDGGLAEAQETTDVPAGIDARFVRVWRVSERNAANTSNVNVGNVDVRWDLSNLGSITASDLRMLIDTDNDGTFADETPISGATSLGGNVYEFAGVSGGAAGFRNNRRFTIATVDKSNTPLPIDLISFEANVNDDKVDLKWITAAEINNDYFTVERSENGKDWEEVLVISGAGNSSQLIEYFEVDYEPISGLSYYRLKQTDFDGSYTYSNVVAVMYNPITPQKEAIYVYPNPVNSGETVMVEFSEITGTEALVVLRDIAGKEFYSKIVVGVSDGKLTGIPIDKEIPKGIYLITATSENRIYSQKLIVR